jgi:hypothetical protein
MVFFLCEALRFQIFSVGTSIDFQDLARGASPDNYAEKKSYPFPDHLWCKNEMPSTKQSVLLSS